LTFKSLGKNLGSDPFYIGAGPLTWEKPSQSLGAEPFGEKKVPATIGAEGSGGSVKLSV